MGSKLGCDRPVLTKEMIRAGCEVLARWHFYDSNWVTEEQTVSEIWEAIWDSRISEKTRKAHSGHR